jgi:hypothetical protein
MGNNRQKTVIYLGAIVIAFLAIGMVLNSVTISKGKRNLNTEKQTSEKLLSEKLSIEKQQDRLLTDFSTLKQMSDVNTKLLAETNIKIADKEKKINSLAAENRSLRTNKKELADLKKAKTELEKESSQLKVAFEKLMVQNKDLQNTISSLEAEKKNLAFQFEIAQKVNTDNFLVTATRGNKAERIVIRASRAKKLNMTFEVPQSLSEAISFAIVTPSGATITPDDKSLTWVFPLDKRNFTASLSTVTGEFEQSRQVVLNYVPKGKLSKGEYKIRILCDGNIIGNCRIMLR